MACQATTKVHRVVSIEPTATIPRRTAIQGSRPVGIHGAAGFDCWRHASSLSARTSTSRKSAAASCTRKWRCETSWIVVQTLHRDTALRAIHPPHSVHKRDRDPPQRHEFKPPLRQRVVARPDRVTARADRPTVLACFYRDLDRCPVHVFHPTSTSAQGDAGGKGAWPSIGHIPRYQTVGALGAVSEKGRFLRYSFYCWGGLAVLTTAP